MRSRNSASWMPVVVWLATLLVISLVSGQRILEKVGKPEHNTLDHVQANLASVNQVSDSVTNLAQKIASLIASSNSKTEIFSPVSIAGALSLLLLGAGGRTEQELLRVMGFNESLLSLQEIHYAFGRLFQDLVTNDPSLEPLIPWRVNDKCNQYDEEDHYENIEIANTTATKSPSHLISVVNGMFLQEGLEPADSFLADTKRYYQSNVENLDFERDPIGAAASINEWCANETHGKIKEMVTGQMVSNSRMIIASALYFNGQWETTFSPYGTRPRPFYLGGHQEPSIDVEMMATTGCFPCFDATAQFDAKIIGLPYKTGNSTMYIVPNGSSREKLQQLQATLGADQLNVMIDQMVSKKGMVMLPKLSISNSIQLSSVLQHFGVHDLFDPTRSNLTRVLNEYASQTGTQQETSIQHLQPTGTGVQPVASAVAVNSVVPTTRSMTKRQANNSLEQGLPLEPKDTNPVSQQQTGVPQQSQQPITIEQSMSFPLDASVCHQVENCEHTEAHGCTCTILLTKDGETECGTQVARYETDPSGKNCIFSAGSNEIGRGYICIKNNYRRSNLQAACERSGCGFFRRWCYCCQQNMQSLTKETGILMPQTTSTPRSHSTKRRPTGRNTHGSQQQQTSQPLQPGEIQKRLRRQEQVQASQPIRQQRTMDHQNERQSSPLLQRQLHAPIYVNEVITQVKLDVNEQGTEGGAVTLALIDRNGPDYTFQVDSPFLILIRHDITKALLFYGAVYDPRP